MSNAANPAIPFLLRLRADVGARLLEHQEQAKRLAADVRQIEDVIRLFDPTLVARPPARTHKGNQWFKRGTCFRRALDVLRNATGPLTITGIATLMFKDIGIPAPTPKQIRSVYGTIKKSLYNHEGGIVRRVGEGVPVRWTVNRVTKA
jgi:hypothetical protein